MNFPLLRSALLVVMLALLAPSTSHAADAPAPDPAKIQATFDAAAARLSRDPSGAKAGLATVAADYTRLATDAHLSDRSRAEAWFNAGVAHHLIGNMGDAVLAYRRAEAIDSTIPGLSGNLSRARAAIAGTPTPEPSTTPPPSSGLLTSAKSLLWTARPQVFILGLTAFVGTWLLLGARLFLARPRFIWPALTAILTIASAAAVLWPAWHDHQSTLHAAVIRADSTPRLGPDPVTFAAGPGGPMRAGTEVVILADRVGGDGRDWVKVVPRERAPESTEGLWLPRSAVEPVFPGHAT